MSDSPLSAARCRGRRPWQSGCTCAPCASSSATASECPPADAKCSAFQPGHKVSSQRQLSAPKQNQQRSETVQSTGICTVQ